MTALQQQPRCPVCSANVRMQDMLPARSLRTYIAGLSYKCPRCELRMTTGALPEHGPECLRRRSPAECPLASLGCLESGLLGMDLEGHMSSHRVAHSKLFMGAMSQVQQDLQSLQADTISHQRASKVHQNQLDANETSIGDLEAPDPTDERLADISARLEANTETLQEEQRAVRLLLGRYQRVGHASPLGTKLRLAQAANAPALSECKNAPQALLSLAAPALHSLARAGAKTCVLMVRSEYAPVLIGPKGGKKAIMRAKAAAEVIATTPDPIPPWVAVDMASAQTCSSHLPSPLAARVDRVFQAVKHKQAKGAHQLLEDTAALHRKQGHRFFACVRVPRRTMLALSTDKGLVELVSHLRAQNMHAGVLLPDEKNQTSVAHDVNSKSFAANWGKWCETRMDKATGDLSMVVLHLALFRS